MEENELIKRIEGSAVETRLHMEVLAEGLEKKIGLVAEGVLTNGERIERLTSEVRDGFAEIRNQFDRRVTPLEILLKPPS